MLWLRAIVAVLMLPGIFAGALPALLIPLDRWRDTPRPIVGGALIAIGLAGFAWCVRDFVVRGRGTLSPWDPPARLVVVGLYRYVRNPMYVAILILLSGWSLSIGSPVIAGYAVALAVAFQLRVMLSEEPTLARKYPDDWPAYAARVPRWLPRLGRRKADDLP